MRHTLFPTSELLSIHKVDDLQIIILVDVYRFRCLRRLDESWNLPRYMCPCTGSIFSISAVKKVIVSLYDLLCVIHMQDLNVIHQS